jgi:hypothetical protein
MKPSFSLSIPKPCSENWNSFTPTSKGGFCGSCQKNVIDFTKASDEEIIDFINHKPEHVCGRFRGNQLKTYSLLPPATIRPGYTLLKAGVLSLLLLFIGRQTPAQTPSIKPATEINQQSKASTDQKKSTEIVIKGIVTDAQDKLPMAAVSIHQKGTMNGTITDAEGKYELKINLDNGRVLGFNFIGMVTQEVTIPDSNNPIIDVSLSLEADVTGLIILTGEVQTDGVYIEKESGLKKFWTKIKNWF